MFISCASETSSKHFDSEKNTLLDSNNDVKQNLELRDGFSVTENGLQYKIHSQNEGNKAKINDFLVADMAYETESGHKIFSKKDLSFKYSQQLFGGAINEGINMMSNGDSATFIIPASKVYQKKIPNFVKENEGIVFQVKIHKILDQAAYKKEIRNRGQASKLNDKKS